MEIMMTFTNGTNDILVIPSGNLDLWALANSNLQEFLIEITVVYYLIYLMGPIAMSMMGDILKINLVDVNACYISS